MELFDNKTKILGEDLKKEISTGSRVSVAAACFSMYAYSSLKEELGKIDEMRFLFTTPAFVDEQLKDSVHKEKREFYIPKLGAESGICGTDLEIRLRNQLTQKAVARECATWIREKARFKKLESDVSVQSMIGVSSTNKKFYYTPVDGFTAADLGFENNDKKLTTIVKNDDISTTSQLLSRFDTLWEDGTLKDVTDQVIDYLSSCYAENSPDYIYYVILYNLFRDYLNDLDEDSMPNEATGFKESLIWNKLYSFQKDGAIGVINKLEKYNGCILADSVGLGKTFTALAVMQYYSLRNKSILVLCPKRLEQNWMQYRGNTTTNVFYKDRIRFDVLFHTDLGRESGKSGGMDLATVNWGNYDLVVIDESHNFRNHRVVHVGRDTRYDFLMKRVMQDGVRTKVLMLSATPVNNRYNDLKNQLLLAYGGDEEEMAKRLGLTRNVQAIFNGAQRDFSDWSKLPQGERHARDLVQSLDMDFSMILDNVTIARSRKHIQKYYNLSDIGRFPSRLPTRSYTPDLTSDETVMKYKDIYEALLKTTMEVYAPLDMLLPSKVEKYEKNYNLGHTQKKNFKPEDEFALQRGRESGLKRIMTVNLLKRLESSVEAFRLTLETVIKTNMDMLKDIEAFKNGDRKRTIKKKVTAEYDLDDEEGDELTGLNEYEVVEKKETIEIRLADLDIITWERLIREDVDILQGIYNDMIKVTPVKDNKLGCLKEVIDEKIASPINVGNRKILIYSAFADTVQYLYKALSGYILNRYGMNTAMISGGNENKATIRGPYTSDRLLTLFSPVSKDKGRVCPNDPYVIDVVMATDCISEGQNLQDCDICINYDIHWNPVRIIQRFGRIDRIGSINDKIQLVNFWPDISLDEYIKLRSRVVNRMTMVNVTATGDENLLTEEENEEIDYRKTQLERLMDGDLLDLEDVDGTISITDLGLNDFVMDLSTYKKTNGDLKGYMRGLHAVAKADPEKGIEPGVIFVLCNRNNGVNINRQNRLHPYYMVYVKSDGEVLYNHLDVKAILDVLRATCKGETEPLRDLCKAFNKETKDGYKMDKYSDILRTAVASIVEVKEESDMRSLFTSGSAVLYQQRIAGLDDFELISFVVLR